MKPVNRRDLLVLGAGLAVAAWLVVRASYGSLPALRWWLPVPLGVLVARSTLYETPPWGPVEQPPYLNAVVVGRGDRDAAGWLARAHERAFVLVPWASLDPTAVLPGRGRVSDLLAALPPEDVAAVVRWEHLH